MTPDERFDNFMLDLSCAVAGSRANVEILDAKTGRDRWPEDQINIRKRSAKAVKDAEWFLKQPTVRAAALALLEQAKQ